MQHPQRRFKREYIMINEKADSLVNAFKELLSQESFGSQSEIVSALQQMQDLLMSTNQKVSNVNKIWSSENTKYSYGNGILSS